MKIKILSDTPYPACRGGYPNAPVVNLNSIATDSFTYLPYLLQQESGLKKAGLSREATMLLCRDLENNHISGKDFLILPREDLLAISPETNPSDAQKVATWLQKMSEVTIPEARDNSSFSVAAPESQVASLEQKPEVSVAGDCEDLS